MDGESGTADESISHAERAQRVVHANTSDDRLTEADMLRTLRDLGFGLTDDELLEVLRRVGVGSLTLDEFTAMPGVARKSAAVATVLSAQAATSKRGKQELRKGLRQGPEVARGGTGDSRQAEALRSCAKAVARSKEAFHPVEQRGRPYNSRGRTEDVAWRDRLHENWKELVKLREASVTASSSSRPLLCTGIDRTSGHVQLLLWPSPKADRHGVRGASSRS